MNARISRGNQYPRVSQSLPYTLLSSPGPSSTTSLSRFLFPPRYTDLYPVPRSLIYTSSWVLHLLQGGTVHHRVPPLRGGVRNGAVRPSASDECDLEKGGREEGDAEYGLPACLPSSFGASAAPFYHPSTPSTYPSSLPVYQTQSLPPPSYRLLSSINFHHVNLPAPSFVSYPGSYISPKSTHNYKTFNLNVKLKRNGFSSAGTVAVKRPRAPVYPDDWRVRIAASDRDISRRDKGVGIASVLYSCQSKSILPSIALANILCDRYSSNKGSRCTS